MYFYWQKQKPPSDEIRPTVSLEAAPATDATDGSIAPTSPHPVSASELTVLSDNRTTGERQPLIEPEPEAGGTTLALSDLDDSKLAASQLGLSGPSDELFDTLMAVSGMNRADFSPSQANILSTRFAALARSLLRETAHAPHRYTVITERLNVRSAPSVDSTIVRMLARGAVITVIGHKLDPEGREWLELGVAEAMGGDQLGVGSGWVCGRDSFGARFVERVA